jgi:hypothetical protein
MNWFFRLLTSDLPDSAVLDTSELSVRGLFPLWAAGLLWLLAGAAIVFLYLREKAKLSLAKRLMLAGLRTALVGVLFFLILRPVLLMRYRVDQQRDIVLLLDVSESMNQRDQRIGLADRMRVAIAENRVPLDKGVSPSISLDDIPANTTPHPRRIDLVRSVLVHPKLNLLETLRTRGTVQSFTLGARIQEAALDGELTAAAPRTALADGLHELLVRGEARVPAAVVVLTDGHDNASRRTLAEVARACGERGTALHIYGLGTGAMANLQLVDATVPPRIFYDDAVAVPVRYRTQGFAAGTAEIALTLGGKVVAQREVTLQTGQEAREVLTFTPRKGEHREERLDLAASIRLKGVAQQETFLDDNEVRHSVRLSDRKVRILYVEDTPRWEYKFLMQTLLRDRRVEASVTLVQGDERALKSGPPYVPGFPTERQELFHYDLLIVGDVPATYFSPERLEWLRDFVSEGGGLLHIAGRRHAPAEFADTPFAELLPVEFVAGQPHAESADQPFVPLLTRAGERSETLTFADSLEENRKIWRELEPWQWHFPVTKLRPGATALLVHPAAISNQPSPVSNRPENDRSPILADGRQPIADSRLPLLATQPFGKGMVLFLASDETWRWRYNTRDQFYARFWGQLAYQLGLPHSLGNLKRVQVELEQSEVVLGQAGNVFVRLLDSEYRPLTLEKLTARIEPLGERGGGGSPNQSRSNRTIGNVRPHLVTLQPVENHPGEYRALLAHAAPGKFVLKIDRPEPASFEFEVKLPPSHELAVAGMAEAELRDAAAASGGHFYREEDLHRLVEQIEPKTATLSLRREVLLWNPLLMLLFVGLITAEWLLRKMSNLS